MMNRLSFRLRLAAVLAVCLTAPAMAEIARAPVSEAGRPVTKAQPMRLECWQHGQRIISEAPLQGFNLGPALRGQSVQFPRGGSGAAEVVLLAVGDATCLLRPAE